MLGERGRTMYIQRQETLAACPDLFANGIR